MVRELATNHSGCADDQDVHAVLLHSAVRTGLPARSASGPTSTGPATSSAIAITPSQASVAFDAGLRAIMTGCCLVLPGHRHSGEGAILGFEDLADAGPFEDVTTSLQRLHHARFLLLARGRL